MTDSNIHVLFESFVFSNWTGVLAVIIRMWIEFVHRVWTNKLINSKHFGMNFQIHIFATTENV